MRCKVLDSVQVTGKYGQKGHSFGSTSKTKFQESASLISHRLSLFQSCTEYLNVYCLFVYLIQLRKQSVIMRLGSLFKATNVTSFTNLCRVALRG